MRAYWNHLKGWITVAVVLFGIAFLDSEFKPLNDLEDFLNSALVLGVIFAGDVLWNWIKTQISR